MLRRGAHVVGVAVVEQFLRGVEMMLRLRGLVQDLLVVIEPEPVHALQEGVDGLLRGAFEVGILNSENELAAHVSGGKPVEDRGADVSDMDLARGRGSESESWLHG